MDKQALTENGSVPFEGFERPDASFIMCPNEFLELVVPNRSLGCIRLVAFVLYETLRWIKDDGTPNTEEIEISFNDLVRKAGISRGAATKAKQEAIENNLIEVLEVGAAKQKGESGRRTRVRLKWSSGTAPVKSLEKFDGFYAGTGYFTAMPHSYFTNIVKLEAPAVIKFVSVIFRNTEGYQTQFGRRKTIPMSFQGLHRLMKVSSPNAVAKTIRYCLQSNYVELVHAGKWSPGAATSKAAVYAPKYAKTSHVSEMGSNSVAANAYKKDSRPDEFKKNSPVSTKGVAEQGFKKCSPIKETKNKTQTMSVDNQSVQRLLAVGFKQRAARELAKKADQQVIASQIEWMKYRKNVENYFAYLRKAIEENWAKPEALAIKEKQRQIFEKQEQKRQKVEQEDSKLKSRVDVYRNQLYERWFKLPTEQRQRLKQVAIESESESCRGYLQRRPLDEKPPIAFLTQLARQQGMPTTIEFEQSVKNSAAYDDVYHHPKVDPLAGQASGQLQVQ